MKGASDWYRNAVFGGWIPVPLIIALALAVIYDCAGSDITMGQAIKYARKGSTLVVDIGDFNIVE